MDSKCYLHAFYNLCLSSVRNFIKWSIVDYTDVMETWIKNESRLNVIESNIAVINKMHMCATLPWVSGILPLSLIPSTKKIWKKKEIVSIS